MKAQGYASGSGEQKVSGNVTAVPVQLVTEDSHEADPELYELEISVYYEVPGKGFAKAGYSHLQIRGFQGQRMRVAGLLVGVGANRNRGRSGRRCSAGVVLGCYAISEILCQHLLGFNFDSSFATIGFCFFNRLVSFYFFLSQNCKTKLNESFFST